jgi:hypothetical protein
MSAQDLIPRGRQHTALRDELDRQGPLWPAERAVLLEAADALLFDEPEAGARETQALDLLAALVENERRTAAESARLRTALLGCGDPARPSVQWPASQPAPLRRRAATNPGGAPFAP